MATVGLTFPTGTRSSVGLLELDVLMTESNELSAKATEYAVEEGSPISDHIVLESERLKLSGWVTPSNVMLMTADGRPKLIEAKATMRRIMTARETVTVTTGMDTYVDMVVEDCSIGRNNEGDKLTVDMSLVQIRKTTLRREAIPPAKTSGTGTGKAGATKTKAGKSPNGEPAATERSKLKTIVSGPAAVNARDRR